MSSDFEQTLQKYADLTVKIGLNLQPGQRLLVRAPISTAPLVRLIAASAYQAGARLVDVLWSDDQLELARYKFAPRDSFEEFPAWEAQALIDYAQHGDATLSISARDPDLLNGQDSALIATALKSRGQRLLPFYDLLMRNSLNWLVVSAPIASWAAKVFPQEAEANQIPKLWDAIFKMCRLDLADPIVAWQDHIKNLIARSNYLNNKRYAALKYTGPGTDLTIGLPRGHLWQGAQSKSTNGILFTPNLPTEEIFTLPHREQVNGMVTASKPLSYGGTLIENFCVTFAAGRVVDVTATAGAAVLRELVATDDGSGRLGEVALVPHSSPIAQSGLLFYNTLFDENAASHVALGKAYKFTLEGGAEMSDEQFMQAGGNTSLVHVDFMIGSGEIDIDGLTDDGHAEPVMRGGEWAFVV